MGEEASSKTVIVTFLTLIFLVFLLILLYKKLNRDTNGKYTIHRMVCGQGGVRDRAQAAVLYLENRLGVHLWPRNRDEEENGESGDEGEEMREMSKQGEDLERGMGGSEKDSKDEGGSEVESDDDYSSLEGANLREGLKLATPGQDVNLTEKEDVEMCDEKGESCGDAESDEGEMNEGAVGGNLTVNLKRFSENIIWSRQGNAEEEMENDVTAL